MTRCKVKMACLGNTVCAWGTDGCIARHPSDNRKLKWSAEQLVAIEGYKTRLINAHKVELRDAKSEHYNKGFANGQAELRRSLLSVLGLPTDIAAKVTQLKTPLDERLIP